MRALSKIGLLIVSVALLGSGVWLFGKGSPWSTSRSQEKQAEVGSEKRRVSSSAEEHDLVFQEPEVDLGVVKGAVDHVFRFTNCGSQPVRISNIQSSCQCTTTKPDRELFQPGETGQLTVHVDARKEPIGKHSYSVVLDYQGQRSGQIRLILRMQHRPDVWIPDRLSLRAVTGRTTDAELLLIDYREQPLTIESLTTSSESLTARIVEKPQSYLPGWRYRIGISYTPPVNVTNKEEMLTISTNDAERSTIHVKVSIAHASRIRVAPSAVRFKLEGITPPKAVSKIFLDDTEGESLEVKTTNPSSPVLKCSVKPTAVPSRLLLEVELDVRQSPAKPDDLSLKIIITKPIAEGLCLPVHVSGALPARP